MPNEPKRARIESDQQPTSHRKAGRLHLLSEVRMTVTLRAIRCVDVHGGDRIVLRQPD